MVPELIASTVCIFRITWPLAHFEHLGTELRRAVAYGCHDIVILPLICVIADMVEQKYVVLRQLAQNRLFQRLILLALLDIFIGVLIVE